MRFGKLYFLSECNCKGISASRDIKKNKRSVSAIVMNDSNIRYLRDPARATETNSFLSLSLHLIVGTIFNNGIFNVSYVCSVLIDLN